MMCENEESGGRCFRRTGNCFLIVYTLELEFVCEVDIKLSYFKDLFIVVEASLKPFFLNLNTIFWHLILLWRIAQPVSKHVCIESH